MVYLVFFTRRAHSWLSIYCWAWVFFQKCSFRASESPSCTVAGHFLPCCRALHFHLVIFRIFPLSHFFRLFRSPWVSTKHPGWPGAPECQQLPPARYLQQAHWGSGLALVKVAECYWSCYWTLWDISRSCETITQLIFWILPPALLSTSVLHPAHIVFHQKIPLKTELFFASRQSGYFGIHKKK